MLKAQKELIMDREGKFPLHAYGSHHCGITNDLTVKYAVHVECVAHVDHRGFMFDQVNVDNYFQAIKKTRLSCERLAMKCATDLIAMIHRDNPECMVEKLEIALTPAPFHASMKYSWTTSTKEAGKNNVAG